MTGFSIKEGISKEHVKKAAQLYAEAFEKKFVKLIADKDSMSELFEKGINPSYALSAVDSDNNLMGLAGFHIGEKSLIDLKMRDFVEMFGFFKGVYKGFLGYFLFDRKALDAKQLLMDGIVVDAVYRGKGVGTALFNALECYAFNKGYRSIKLDVIDENPKAKKLYTNIGFREIGHEKVPKFLHSKIGVSGYTGMVKTLNPNA